MTHDTASQPAAAAAPEPLDFDAFAAWAASAELRRAREDYDRLISQVRAMRVSLGQMAKMCDYLLGVRPDHPAW